MFQRKGRQWWACLPMRNTAGVKCTLMVFSHPSQTKNVYRVSMTKRSLYDKQFVSRRSMLKAVNVKDKS